MKKNIGKRLAILLATGVLALGSGNKSIETEASKNVKIEDTKTNIPPLKEIGGDEREYNLKYLGKPQNISDKWKNDEEFFDLLDNLIIMKKAKKLNLEKNYDKYIRNIYINGDAVKVEFTYGMDMVVGNVESLILNDINLDELVITDLSPLATHMYLDTIPNKENNDEKIPITQLPKEYIKEPEFKTFNINLNNTKVCNELRLQDDETKIQDEIINKLDLTECKNISLYKFKITNELINTLETDEKLETLILTYPDFEEIGNEFTFSSDSLKKIAIQMDGEKELNKIDLNGCKNLEGFSGGLSTSIEDLNCIKECQKLKYFSLGDYIFNHDLDYIKDAEEQWEEYCFEKRDTDYFAVANVGTNNFIRDISSLKGKNIEILNISHFKNVSSEEFKNVVLSIPNLKKIIGYEISNAALYDEELVKYLNEKGIEHPFSETSKEIKNEIERIVATLITPEMTDFEKVKAISKYILEHLEYDIVNFNVYPKSNSKDIRKKLWGETLYNVTIANNKENAEKDTVEAVCYGYATLAEALYTEAGVKSLTQETTGHIYNLVDIDGILYKVDLTCLDDLLKKHGIKVEDFDFKINSEDYMIPIGSPTTETEEKEPNSAKQQREIITKINCLLNEIFKDNNKRKDDNIQDRIR